MTVADEALAQAVLRFDQAVTRADRDEAIAVVHELVGRGVDPLTVMTDVVAEVQRGVGLRWQTGTWSVAQEHAATTVSMAALEAIAGSAKTAPGSASGRPQPRGHAVVACAEHEWHAAPAMIITAGLRASGWEVTPLGASTPSGRLTRYLQDLGPDLTAVSCSVAASLPTARDFVVASAAAGIPVLAGGAAFGPDDRRAVALGAHAWAPDVRSAVRLASTLPRVVPAALPLPEPVVAELAALRGVRHALVDRVAERWRELSHSPAEPADDNPEEWLCRSVARQVFDAAAGAVVTGDDRLVEETATWTAALLQARGFAPRAVCDLGRAATAEFADFPWASRVLERCWPQ